MRFFRYAAASIFLITLSLQGFSQDISLTLSTYKTFALKINYAVIHIPESPRDTYSYASYSEKNKKGYRCSFLTLNNLAKAAESINDAAPLNCLYSHLVFLEHNILRRTVDFEKLSAENNGSVAVKLKATL